MIIPSTKLVECKRLVTTSHSQVSRGENPSKNPIIVMSILISINLRNRWIKKNLAKVNILAKICLFYAPVAKSLNVIIALISWCFCSVFAVEKYAVVFKCGRIGKNELKHLQMG